MIKINVHDNMDTKQLLNNRRPALSFFFFFLCGHQGPPTDYLCSVWSDPSKLLSLVSELLLVVVGC